MKKLIVILIVIASFTSCKKSEVCVVTCIKTSLQPCEGYPQKTVYVYENTDGQYRTGTEIDTVKYCFDNVPIERKIITNCQIE